MPTWKEYMKQQDQYAQQFPQHITNLIPEPCEPGQHKFRYLDGAAEKTCEICYCFDRGQNDI